MRRVLISGVVALGMLAGVGVYAQSKGKVSATASDEDQKLLELARQFFQPLPAVADNPQNPVAKEKVELGKMLYYDPRLSKSGLISCNTCHNLATYGVDNLPTSIGHGWAIGPRNAPSVYNAALHVAQF